MVLIYTQIYLTSFFLNEFNSPCVSKLPNVSNIMMLMLKLYSLGSYTSLLFLSHLLIARCDIGVQLSVRSFVRPSVRPSVHNLCQGAYSVAVIAGSMKPCIVITLDTHLKKAP